MRAVALELMGESGVRSHIVATRPDFVEIPDHMRSGMKVSFNH